MQTDVRFKPLYPDTRLPEPATEGSAGWDVYSRLGAVLDPGEVLITGLGFAMELEPNYCALLLPRSGRGSREGLVLANTIGLIDADYRHEVMLALLNRQDPAELYIGQLLALLRHELSRTGEEGLAASFERVAEHWQDRITNEADPAIRIHPGERIAQLLILPVARATLHIVEELSSTDRKGGLGSTGS